MSPTMGSPRRGQSPEQLQRQQERYYDAIKQVKANTGSMPKLSTSMAKFVEQFLVTHQIDNLDKYHEDDSIQQHKQQIRGRARLTVLESDEESTTTSKEEEEEEDAAFRKLGQIRLDKDRFKVQAGNAQVAFVHCLRDNLDLEDKLLQVLAIVDVDGTQEEDIIAKMQQVWDQVQRDKSEAQTERDEALNENIRLKRKIDTLQEEKLAWEQEKLAWEQEKGILLQLKRHWQQEEHVSEEHRPDLDNDAASTGKAMKPPANQTENNHQHVDEDHNETGVSTANKRQRVRLGDVEKVLKENSDILSCLDEDESSSSSE